MTIIRVLSILVLAVLAGEAAVDWAADTNLRVLKAFPGAEGFGANTTGGRGGRVLYVTNLDDAASNPPTGSLRWAINQTGARTIMFQVAGEIKLAARLNIRNDNLTIAGHSAPGDGIVISGNTVYVGANNVIIRYMRFRMGDLNDVEDDAIWGRNQRDIIIDHSSMSWGTDECASFYDNENFTLQWSILSESLRTSVHEKGNHGYLGIWGGRRASFHHNLIAHHDSRNPRFNGARYSNRASEELVDFRNNVIYNWGANSGYAGEGGRYNMVNNYYKPGPQSANSARIFQPNADNGNNSQAAGVWGTFYVAGNYMLNVNGTPNTTVINDNWTGIHPNPSSKNKNELRSDVEFEKGDITTHTAQEAYELVLARAGASFRRDSTDRRVVNETRNRLAPVRASGGAGTRAGMIDSQRDVGGWDTYTFDPSEVPIDSDGGGIPDYWKIANGLPLNDPSVSNQTNLSGGTYTNLEVYLYSLLLGSTPPPPPAWTYRGGGEFIDSLMVSDAANAANWSVQSDFRISVAAYGDRTHTITAVPADLQGAEWVRAAMDSRTRTSPDTLVRFRMKKAGTVYVAHEDRVTAKPAWLAARGFTATGHTMAASDGQNRTYTIYGREFAQGANVALGINSNDGITSTMMYIIAVKETSTTAVTPAQTALPANYALNVARINNGGVFRVNYSIRDRGAVRIDLFDIKGGKVRTLVNSSRDAGAYQEHFSADGLATGMYIVRLRVGTRTLQQQFVVVR
ncbi:MAG: hypothetical protein LBC70_03385 [Chitinispirillales bacterium]|jgi:hypothetical protein|nr:hypothetical protein [Chitinispirillales bacterium]